MKKTKVILTGGFLSAGKTTSMIKLAELLKKRGVEAALITNDQGSELVDGSQAKISGFPCVAVKGGCFCCRYTDLVKGMDSLLEENDPEILIAEPVGSCTDLVATVFIPLAGQYHERFTLAPYSVIVDGNLLYQTAISNGFMFSGEIRYLYCKQLEEADIIVLNKIDILEEEKQELLIRFLTEKYPAKIVFPVCALDGSGFDDWLSYILHGKAGLNPLDNIDYSKYGYAESLLGWYNSSIYFCGGGLFDPNDLIRDILECIAAEIIKCGGITAHLKAIALSEGGIVKASIAASCNSVGYSCRAYDLTHQMELLLNARVEIKADILQHIVNVQIEKHAKLLGLNFETKHEESFHPSFPKPTHPYERKNLFAY